LVDEISLAIAIAALVVSIGAIIPLYLDYFARRAEKRRIDLEVERFGEITPFPIDSNWTVRIHSPRKMIEHCSVVIEWGSGLKVLLPIGSINIHETKIPVGGSANFRVPEGIVPQGSTIVIKDGTKEILRRKAQDVPLVNP
jgi:hypothetical protein